MTSRALPPRPGLSAALAPAVSPQPHPRSSLLLAGVSLLWRELSPSAFLLCGICVHFKISSCTGPFQPGGRPAHDPAPLPSVRPVPLVPHPRINRQLKPPWPACATLSPRATRCPAERSRGGWAAGHLHINGSEGLGGSFYGNTLPNMFCAALSPQ